jgi:DNA-binding response OmpR family regulator
MQILIVEDEKNLANALVQIIKEQKWQATAVYDGNEGCQMACSQPFDMVILDVMLPGMNGNEIVRIMRQNKIETPVLMLSALSEVPDKVTGLTSGADDYMAKPFSPDELIARIRALTRRRGEIVLNQLEYEDLVLDLDQNELKCNNRNVHLSYKEFEIMRLFMMHPAMLFSKEELINQVWGNDSEAIDNNVEVYISFIRKKLSFLKSRVNIKSIRKVGYRLEVQDD